MGHKPWDAVWKRQEKRSDRRAWRDEAAAEAGDWWERIERANEARELGQRLREGKPAGFKSQRRPDFSQ